MMGAFLLGLALSSSAGGGPAPATLDVAIARPTRDEKAPTSFDLRVTWPKGASPDAPLTELASKCAPALTLPDGSAPKLEMIVSSTSADGFVARVAYAAREAPGPSIWRITVRCPGIDSGPAQPFGVFGTPPNAHLVIAFGAKARGEAESWLEAQGLTGVPSHDPFPLIVESQWVLGLNPGFFVVVLAASDDPSVASQLARELNAHGVSGSYVKAAWWPAPEPLRLLVVDEVADENLVVPSSDRNEIFIVQEKMPIGSRAAVRGRSMVWADGRAVIPFTRTPAGGEAFEVVVSAAQTSCDAKPARIRFEENKRVQRLKKLALVCVQGG
jgi:hypothetical protein